MRTFLSKTTSIRIDFFFLFVLFFLLTESIGFAQVVGGKITGADNQPVPYATLFVEETREGTISNTDGNFMLKLPNGQYHITIRSLGYLQEKKEVFVNADSVVLNVVLKKQEYEIKEVKVFPGKEDPAYFIIRKAMAKVPYYRKKIKHYEADLYIKSNFAFTKIPKIYQNKIDIEGKKMKEVLKENMTYVIESQNKITFDYPQKYEQEVISKKTSLYGFDEPPVMELITANFYEERPNQVISPLSSLALKHYNYRYEGFVTAGDFDVFKIKVTPKRKSDELVEGYIYIVDKLWCIYNVDFTTSFEFFTYKFKQQYENLGDGNWLPVSHVIDGDFSMLGLKGLFYYGASLKYRVVEGNDDLNEQTVANPPEKIQVETKPGEKPVNEKVQQFQSEVNGILAKEELSNKDVVKAARLNRKILKEQYKDSTITSEEYDDYEVKDKKDKLAIDTFVWDTLRAIPLTPAEIRSYQFTDSLMAMNSGTKNDTLGDNREKKKKSLFKKIISGHYDFARDSLTRVGYKGLISIENFGFNSVDGYTYKQVFNIRLNPDSAKFIYIDPEIGYAFNRQAVFGAVRTRFRNILASNNTFSVNFGKESRDFKPGKTGIAPTLNLFSSWFFAQNYMKLYETSFFEMNTNQQVKNGFSVQAGLAFNDFKQLENHASYILSDKKEFGPNTPANLTQVNPALQNQKSFEYSLGLNYRKRIRKPWLMESPFLFMGDFYSFGLSYKQGIRNLFSSVSDFALIDFSFNQQANISPSAGIDWRVNAGIFLSSKQMHFSQFKHFNTTEIPVLFNSFSTTFQLLNDYLPSTKESYLNVGGEFRTEYLLFRYLSFINTRTWSESFHLNYLTTPTFTNYWEAGYSLNSLFFAGNIGVFAGFKENNFEGAMVKISISGFD